jgi:hypothetical protein
LDTTNLCEDMINALRDEFNNLRGNDWNSTCSFMFQRAIDNIFLNIEVGIKHDQASTTEWIRTESLFRGTGNIFDMNEFQNTATLLDWVDKWLPTGKQSDSDFMQKKISDLTKEYSLITDETVISRCLLAMNRSIGVIMAAADVEKMSENAAKKNLSGAGLFILNEIIKLMTAKEDQKKQIAFDLFQTFRIQTMFGCRLMDSLYTSQLSATKTAEMRPQFFMNCCNRTNEQFSSNLEAIKDNFAQFRQLVKGELASVKAEKQPFGVMLIVGIGIKTMEIIDSQTAESRRDHLFHEISQIAEIVEKIAELLAKMFLPPDASKDDIDSVRGTIFHQLTVDLLENPSLQIDISDRESTGKSQLLKPGFSKIISTQFNFYTQLKRTLITTSIFMFKIRVAVLPVFRQIDKTMARNVPKLPLTPSSNPINTGVSSKFNTMHMSSDTAKTMLGSGNSLSEGKDDLAQGRKKDDFEIIMEEAPIHDSSFSYLPVFDHVAGSDDAKHQSAMDLPSQFISVFDEEKKNTKEAENEGEEEDSGDDREKDGDSEDDRIETEEEQEKHSEMSLEKTKKKNQKTSKQKKTAQKNKNNQKENNQEKEKNHNSVKRDLSET